MIGREAGGNLLVARVVNTVEEVRGAVARARGAGTTVGLVPTMGFLHEGHLSLVDRCRELAEYAVLSIYVNPLQFGPEEDFEEYPRDLDHDLARAEERGVDLVFAPSDRELYPRPVTAVVRPARLADRLCGLSRPGHFEGVLTVVAKLFGIVEPDLSVFGQKDLQQALLIQKMVEDLNMPIKVEIAPTVREEDALAMSSRNAYLAPDERDRAVEIARTLAGAVRAYRGGERDAAAIRSSILEALESRGGIDVEYAEVVSWDELEPVERADEHSVVAVAAHIGSTRLIDNVRLARPDPGLEKMLARSSVEEVG